jgi:hypothetical protein
MGRKISKNEQQRGSKSNRLPGHDAGGVIDQLIDYIKHDWTEIHEYILTALGPHAFVIKTLDFVTNEQPKLMTLCDHQQVILMGVYGDDSGRERLVGYCLMFSGAPTLHYHSRYIGLSYSDAQDIRTRQMLVIFDDTITRLARFGLGTFDYLWACKKETDEQFTIEAADHAQHKQFSGSWRAGM